MGVIKPHKLLFFSFIIWLVIYLQVEAQYLYEGSLWYPLLTLLGYIVTLLMGIFSLKNSHVKPPNLPSHSKVKQITVVLFYIGALGVLLKLYSGLFVSGIFLAEDIFEQRLENMEKELTGGALGIVGSILFPFSVIAMLIGIYNYKVFNKLFLILLIVAGLFPFLETIFLGGRTVIALLGTTIAFVIYASYSKNSKLKLTKFMFGKASIISFPSFLRRKTVWIPLVVFSIVFVSYSLKVVNQRLERFNYGKNTILVWEKTDYQWVKFDKKFKQRFYESNEEDRAKMLGYHSLKHYFAHGVVEYIRLVNHLDKSSGYYYGMYEFNVFFKFFKAVGLPLPSQAELGEIIERQSVYRTFWGEFYIDFGFFGLIIMFFWGRFVKRMYLYAKSGNTPYVIFYGYLSTILITSFFLNFLMGSSSYYLFGFLVTIVVFKLWPENLKFYFRA